MQPFKTCLTIGLFCIGASLAYAQTAGLENPFKAIDEHAAACPRSAANSVETLAAYLRQGTHNDLEKTRAIYIWLTKFIQYDADLYNSDRMPDESPAYVLKKRKALCGGFSSLFRALGLAMDLDVRKIDGYSKGVSYYQGKHFTDTNHSWNAVRIDGRWRLFDATWGEGNGENSRGKLSTEKEFDPFWFDVDPYAAIFSHLPADSSFQLVQPAVTLRQFESWPEISHNYFKFGFNPEKTFRKMQVEPKTEFPQCFKAQSPVSFSRAPESALIPIGKNCAFECRIPGALQMAVMDARNRWTYFKSDNGVFRLDYKAAVSGKLSVLARFSEKDTSFDTVLEYRVGR